MWLTSWWVPDYWISMDFLIQTAWYSIELHGHAMAFHGTASVLQGTPWHSMELHDIPWNFMAFHGTPSLLHGTPWNSMAFHGTPWILHGTPWHSMDTPWRLHGSFVEFHGFPSISMEFGFRGISHGHRGAYFRNFTVYQLNISQIIQEYSVPDMTPISCSPRWVTKSPRIKSTFELSCPLGWKFLSEFDFFFIFVLFHHWQRLLWYIYFT